MLQYFYLIFLPVGIPTALVVEYAVHRRHLLMVEGEDNIFDCRLPANQSVPSTPSRLGISYNLCKFGGIIMLGTLFTGPKIT